MTLKEQLARLKGEFLALKKGIEAGDADAIERATKLKADIDEVETKIANAEGAKRLLDAMGNLDGKGHEPKSAQTPRTLGQRAAEAVVGKAVKGQRNDIIVPAKDDDTVSGIHKLPTFLATGQTYGINVDYDMNIVESAPRRQLVMEDLFGSETISGNSLTYFVIDPTADPTKGGPGYVAEGGLKPAAEFGMPTPVTESLAKIAMHYKESDELLEDAAWLASSIDNRALYQFDLKIDNDLLNGSTQGGLKGLLQRNGIQSATYANTAALADAIFDAMTKVQQGSGFAPDALVINPADYQALRLAKDENGQYYGGGFFAGQYGNGSVMENPPVWGLRPCVTTAVSAGTVLVGAFRLGASVINKGGTSVEVTNLNEDDFTHNLVTIRVERRMGLAVRYPKAFVKLTKSA